MNILRCYCCCYTSVDRFPLFGCTHKVCLLMCVFVCAERQSRASVLVCVCEFANISSSCICESLRICISINKWSHLVGRLNYLLRSIICFLGCWFISLYCSARNTSQRTNKQLLCFESGYCVCFFFCAFLPLSSQMFVIVLHRQKRRFFAFLFAWNVLSSLG